MQAPSLYQQSNPQFPDHEQLKCPRCDSGNTKFCYYNNYNLSQPRHYCKNCRRHWTKGGSLRHIPVGGGIRKATKRGSSSAKLSSPSSSSSNNATDQAVPESEPLAGYRPVLLTANDHFRSLIEGLNSNGFGKDLNLDSNSVSGQDLVGNTVPESNNRETYLGVEENRIDSSYRRSTNGWPDLTVYTPDSTFR